MDLRFPSAKGFGEDVKGWGTGVGMTKSKVLDLAREVGMEDDKLLLKLSGWE